MNWILIRKFLQSFGIGKKETFNHDIFRIHVIDGRFYPQTNVMGPWTTFIVENGHWIYNPPDFKGYGDPIRAEVEFEEAMNIIDQHFY